MTKRFTSEWPAEWPKKLKLAMLDMKLMCFGVVEQCDRLTPALVRLDFNSGTVIPVESCLVDFEGSLQRGDHVVVWYSQTGGARVKKDDISVNYVAPEIEAGVGLITAIEDGNMVIDNNIKGSRSLVESCMEVGDAVEYVAIRCDGDTRYRCWKAVVLDKAIKEELFPLLNLDIRKLQLARENKKGLVVSVDDLYFKMKRIGETQRKTIYINNITKSIPHTLTSIEIITDNTSNWSHFQVISPVIDSLPISPSSTVEILIEATSKRQGIFSESLAINFKGGLILRELNIAVGDDNFLKRYTTGYQDLLKTSVVSAQDMFYNFLRKPKRKVNETERKSILQSWIVDYEIAKYLKKADWDTLFQKKHSFLLQKLTPKNYCDKLHKLLFFEETYLFRQFQRYSQIGVTLGKENTVYRIFVRNLAESRPSPTQGDTVALYNKLTKKSFWGRITHLRHDDVLVKMCDDFEAHSNLVFDVHFYFSRTQLRIQHESIERMSNGSKFAAIFPKQIDLPVKAFLDVTLDAAYRLVIKQEEQYEKQFMDLHRKDLNACQKAIICNVLRGEWQTLPYLIRGPPGTGKTTTIVEIILLLITYSANATVLICTHSNSAADLILEKLLQTNRLRSDELIRIVSKRQAHAIKPELQPYCGTLARPDPEGQPNDKYMPAFVDLASLLSFRIVIGTVGYVGNFYDLRVPHKHFTHLILDEAGQCRESETLVPMTIMENHTSQVILVGDDKQLGPVIHWPTLETCGLGESLFERIMNTPIYDPTSPEYNCVLSSQLSYNYRSIPSIMKLYNNLFYNDSLKAIVSADQDNFYRNTLHEHLLPPNELRNKRNGVAFFAILGNNSQTSQSPSWMNCAEAEQVLDLYARILQSDSRIKAADIGIITPYCAQVTYIRQLIEIQGLEMCKVGSVTEFQGLERQIIIVSTVRSTKSLLQYDRKFNLGFLTHDKRTNVAISRAKSALIIVGDPQLLQENEKWKSIVLYTQSQRSYFEPQKKLVCAIEKK